MSETPRKDAIRNAATIVLVRRDDDTPRVLMGQRGKNAAFMPNKFVFPGGAVDPQDALVTPQNPVAEHVYQKLADRTDPELVPALPMTAIRELWEETGLALAVPEGDAPAELPSEWQTFFAAGHRANAGALDFVFRAITPPGRPRRFDARFFLATASSLQGDPDDFSGAEDELSHLSWLTLSEARDLDLPFITEVVLAEIEARLKTAQPRPIPFFFHADGVSNIDQI